MARRNGDVWYVGGLTNWDKREVELDFSFLGKGTYKAEIFKDGINADLVSKDYKREVLNVTAGSKIRIDMASGGGFIIKINK